MEEQIVYQTLAFDSRIGYNKGKECDLTMANSSSLYVRMDSSLKDGAESILKQLGITSSGAVQMFYQQIILHKGIPFDVKLPEARPVAIGGMSRQELDTELKRGMDALEQGQRCSVEDVDRELVEEFGI